MDFLLTEADDRRPAPGTLRELRSWCDAVLARGTFEATFGARLGELVPPDHPLRHPELPLLELATALLDPVRDPERYGGAVEHIEARWQQLGAWLLEIGMPVDACQHVVRAVARTARDVSGEDWDSAASSGWAALQLWMQWGLDAGVEQVQLAASAPTPTPTPDTQGVHAAPAPGPDARTGAERVAERLAERVAELAAGRDGTQSFGHHGGGAPSDPVLASRPSG